MAHLVILKSQIMYLIKKVLIFLSIILLFRIGIEALIIGQVVSTGIAFTVSTGAVIRTHGIKLNVIAVPFVKLCIIMAICLLFNYFIIEPLYNSDWLGLLLKCTLIPLIFLAAANLLRLSSITDIKNVLAKNTTNRCQDII